MALQRSLLRISPSGRIVFSGIFNRDYGSTSSENPADFVLSDCGKLYTVSMETSQALNFPKNLPSKYIRQLNTFNECTWLCREQLLDGVHFLQKSVDIKRPAMRAVLWGGFGTGKTLTLQQLIHCAHLNGFVLFTVRNAMEFLRCREVHMSIHKEGRINTPSCAMELLQNFKAQNQRLWKTLSGLTTDKTYHWSKMESTESGKPITDIVEIGISASYLATDCVSALAKELRRHATSGAIKLFVGIDHANSLYGTKTTIKKLNRTKALPEEISLTYNLRKFFGNNWTNGACVLIADKAELSDARDQVTIPIDTPLELFGEEGFDAIDPFIPIETRLYTLDETNAMYEYYKDRNWLTSEGARSDEGRKQLAYLSGFNPYYYERLCAFN